MKVFTVGSGEARKSGLLNKARNMGLVPSLGSSIKGVQIPAPPVTVTDAPSDSLAQHLAYLYQQGVKWSGAAEDLKARYWMAYGVLRKNQFELARRVKAALRSIADESSSKLPMCMYVWWYCNSMYEKKGQLPGPTAVFNTDQLTSPRWRRYYWSDCGEAVKAVPTLWPKADEDIADMIHEFEAYDAYFETIEQVPFTWDLEYGWQYKIAKRDAALQREEILEKVMKRHEKFDVGLYIADPREYLKIKNITSSRLK